MTDIGRPFQGECWWAVETQYSAGWTDSSTSYLPSDKVIDCRIETGEIQTPLRGISSPSVCGWTKNNFDPTLHVEWILQPDTDSLATYCCIRDTSTGSVRSLHFKVGANTDDTSKDSWWNLDGCVCKTFTISSSRGEPYTCTADFSVATISKASNCSASDKPSALSGKYASFNYAGSITFTGTQDTVHITDSFDITVENNVTDYYTVGSHNKLAAIAGAVDVTGSCDISLDNGGEAMWDDVIRNQDISSIVIDTGVATGADDVWTLTNGKFTSLGVDINISGEGMMSSIPFRFKHITVA